MKSIYRQNFLVTASLVLLSFLILGAAFAAISYEFMIDDKRQTIEDTAQTVAETVSAKMTEMELTDWDLRMTITTIARSTGMNISICGTDGVVLACSDQDLLCRHVGRTIPRKVLDTLSASGAYNGISNFSGYYESPSYVSGAPISVGGSEWTVGCVFVAANTSSMMQIWRSFTAIFLFAAVAVLVFALAATLVTTRKQSEPMREMAAAASRFARGDFSVRVKGAEEREDELGELMLAFNSMADSLEKSEQQRRDFVANISHELKTPMTSISGFADGIIDGTIPPEKQDEYLRIISSETRRLSRLVRKMLDLSRLQSADRSEILQNSFDISEVIVNALASLEKKISDRGLDVDVQLPEERILVLGDMDGITQVIYNLLDNAAKFADPGSTLGLSLWKKGEKAYVSVRNHGQNISKEELPLIFERFHKTDRSRGLDKDGVGLGLYIVKTIIQNHGEEITASSHGGLTEFKFSLQIKS